MNRQLNKTFFLLGCAANLLSVSTALGFYDPNLQRWISRDPVTELGFGAVRPTTPAPTGDGANLYTFNGNTPPPPIDPYGLKLYYCTVPTTIFPAAGIGRHGYLWDDRPNTPDNQRECGQEGSSGYGSTQGGNSGPVSGKPGDLKAGTKCVPIDGSDGREDAVMKCCRNRVKN